MAKPAKSDRQAVIDSIRKQQKGAEKRRGLMIVGVCAVIAVLIIGAAAYQPIKDWWELRAFNDLGVSEIGAPASSCQDVKTKPVTGGAEHVATGTPVTYERTPPAFGSHWNEAGVAPAPIDRKLYTDDRPALESLVHNLEHGYTVLWYDDTIAEDEESMDTLRAIAGKFSDSGNFRNKFIAAPWTAEDGEPLPEGQNVAFTHWSAGDGEEGNQEGIWQFCSDVSGAALEQFMIDYPYLDSPEPAAG